MSRLSEQFTIGRLKVTALSDGAPDRELSGFFHGIDASEWTRAVGITDPGDPVPFNFGSFLIQGDGRTTLIDTGFGPPAEAMGVPGGGQLIDRLSDHGVAPEDVDVIVHTHLHPDHCGWNISSTGQLTFPRATIFVSRRELEYWTSEAEADDYSRAARNAVHLPSEMGRIETFDGEFSVTNSLTMVPTPGHTPGHSSALVASENQHLLITGDAAHHPVHFEHHDWIPEIDLNPEDSKRSRAALSRLAVENDAIVTGGHFPILTLGRVARTESGYIWKALD